jgi:hypothetical protein
MINSLGSKTMISKALSRPWLVFGYLVLTLLCVSNISCSGGTHTSPGGGGGGGGGGVSGPFFGIATNVLTDPWPASLVPVASWRSLVGSVKWADINTADGTYDFSTLDQWLSKAQAGGQDVMFTMYATPSWASSRGVNCVSQGNPTGCVGPPNTACSFQSQNGPGICDPPDDLNCDGSGPNLHFQNFVTALLNHVGPGKIKYWEMWNEPSVPHEWNAVADCPSVPNAQYLMLARMAQDMRNIVTAVDSKAMFTTPAPVGDVKDWMSGYLANSNGGSLADVIAFHGYVSQTCQGCPVPEDVLGIVQNLQNVTTSFGQQNKPLFDTEGSWGSQGGAPAIADPQQQAAFAARYYLVQMGAGVAKLYWYGWDFSDSGEFYDTNTQALNAAGVAHKQIVKWTTGRTVQPCIQNGTQWSCSITGSAAATMAIWDTSQTCSGGVCGTTNITAPQGFTSYLDVAGNTHSVSGGTVPVGAQPILLTN